MKFKELSSLFFHWFDFISKYKIFLRYGLYTIFIMSEYFYYMTTIIKLGYLTLWPWKWTLKQQHIIYVKCEYFINKKR